ncbi:MAG: hypothetical protein RIQ81_1507 [Pseudomonadota bacterium]
MHFIASFLSNVGVSGVPRTVDFGRTRGNYEERIFTEGVLAVRRGSLHDYYNLMAWSLFPRSKVAINQIHHEAIEAESSAAAGERPGRGPRRDFLTILDEAGVLLLVDPTTDVATLAGEIRRIRQQASEMDYPSVITRILEEARVSMHVLGHALMETARVQPGRMASVGAFAVILPADEGGPTLRALADRQLSRFLLDNRESLHPSLFPSLRLDVVFECLQRS